ncbi:hypothetical protein DPMN_092498 [Dreissena polymorpha]|uniref:Uncharacterized protein n=1 Tax=Dreissena polymorpha TaxID=45954 RepID=A0A9D4L3S6_DREPO|nr:hypothetical protein DPMN_092498 [Dreissena polymorpha]
MLPLVLTRKNAPPPGGHVFQQTRAIFELIQTIIRKNVLTKVLTRTNAPPPGGHVFQPTETSFVIVQDIIATNLLTKFHDDRKINVASRVLKRFYYSHIQPYEEKCPAPGGHVFQATTNHLTKYNEDQTINANVDAARRTTHDAGRMTDKRRSQKLTMSTLCSDTKEQTCSLQPQKIIRTNDLTKFHAEVLTSIKTIVLTRCYENWTINVTFRVITSLIYPHICQNAPPPCAHINLLTKFQHQTINLDSTVKNTRLIEVITNVLTKFHEDWTINVTCRKNAHTPGGHVFQPTKPIFELVQYIIETNLLTKLHEDGKINVACNVLTRQMPRPWLPYVIGTYVLAKFHEDRTIIWPLGYIIGTKLVTKFREDRTINVTSKKNTPPPGDNVFQPTEFYYSHIKINSPPPGSHFHDDWKINVTLKVLTKKMLRRLVAMTNLLTKFHKDRTMNVDYRVLTIHVFQPMGTICKPIKDIVKTNLLTKFHQDRTINYPLEEKCSAPWRPWFFYPTGTVFKRVQAIIGTNFLTKFYDGRTIHVASKVLTRKNAPPPGGHVFQQTRAFHDDRNINVVSKVLTRQNAPTPCGRFHKNRTINVASRVLTSKNAPPPRAHVFQLNGTIFIIVQDITETNLLTKFHDNRTINVASREKCPAPGGHVFQPTEIIFELIQDSIAKNLMTKFHEDRTINAASRVLTRKNAPPPCGHVFQATVTIFELVQDLVERNHLTEFHEDRTINVASSVLTSQMLTTQDAQRTTDDGQNAITQVNHVHIVLR